jgi:hypothetical protein
MTCDRGNQALWAGFWPFPWLRVVCKCLEGVTVELCNAGKRCIDEAIAAFGTWRAGGVLQALKTVC